MAGKDVLLIDHDGEQVGVVSFKKASEMAKTASLDLVVVAEQSKPPVCRIMDFGKLQYEQKKNIRSQKKHKQANRVKEVKFRVNIDKHDFDYKLNHAIDFLSKGCKVKITLMFRGREMAHKDLGFELIQRVLENLKEHAVADSRPNLMGRNITVIISPIKK